METININGKEYTKDDLLERCLSSDMFVEYWDWEDLIGGVFNFLNNFPRIEPEPPKLRRMSELPEFKRVNIKVDRFSAKNNSGSFWIIGSKRIDRAGNIVIESKFATFRFEAGIYLNNEHGAKLTGWLPLPNPNDIEL